MAFLRPELFRRLIHKEADVVRWLKAYPVTDYNQANNEYDAASEVLNVCGQVYEEQTVADPAAAPTLTVVNADGNLASNTYFYAVTYYTPTSETKMGPNAWIALGVGQGQVTLSAIPTYTAPTAELEVIDRVGGGDGFAAGFIYGLLTGETPEEAIKLGWAHGALLTTFPGDTTMATVDQVRAFAAGGSARIQR